MVKIFTPHRLLVLAAVALAVIATQSGAFGQCGVYLKRSSSKVIPYSKVHLDTAIDMTGDGVVDIVASEESNVFSRTRIFVIPNSGNGTFGTPIALDPPAGTLFDWDFVVGRVNGDALNDIVAYIPGGGGALRSYLNNGNGTYTEVFGSVGGSASIGLYDVNGDGINDYVNSGTSVRYRPGAGDGTFGAQVTAVDTVGTIPADFNGDGKADFINVIGLYMNNGNGTFTSSTVTPWLPFGSIIYGAFDFNSDGKTELLVNTTGGQGIGILKKTDTGFERTDFPINDVQSWHGTPLVGNFSGNSAPDIVYSSDNLGKKAVYTNDGNGNFARQDYSGNFDQTSYIGERVIGDFDADGKTDLVQSASALSNQYPFFKDVSSLHFMRNVCNQPGQPRIVDWDRSGTTDFTYWNPANGEWGYSTSNGSTPSSLVTIWGSGSLGDIPTPGDFDGDGVTDLAVYRQPTGVWYIRRSSDAAWAVASFGLPGDKPVAADYDGDTISDIAVWRPSDGNWHVWYMGTQTYGVVHFGATSDKPVPEDFDGDHKADFAVFRPSNGGWYYLRSSDGSFYVTGWGQDGDRPVAGDYDGDGRADIAVYRPSDRTLYVRRSFDSMTAGFLWGADGDDLQVGDFDGDFVADFTVYRPSTRQWWPSSWVGKVYGVSGGLPTSSILRIE